MYTKVKRLFDLFLSIVLVCVFAIPMIIVAICIKTEDGGPIIYKSKRMGKGLKVFNTYKFRSMKTEREELHSELTHDEMVTKTGKIIRKTSIDELPQLFNIIKGEMSFIGPRPWIPEYYEWFTDEQKRRVEVLPGISGLAQVKGRNGIDIFEKINYDIEYVDNISFKEDMKLIIETIKTVFSKANAEISEQGIKDEIRKLKDTRELLEKAKTSKVG
ncbi:MAG: sugar transferase [Clostridia bacterium]|nr:sugar transferase [Clostridia bacterium]